MAADATDWPDFEVPADALEPGVTSGDRPAAPGDSGTPPVPAAATPPVTPGTTPPAATPPATSTPPAAAAGTPTPPASDDPDAPTVPRYRLNETAEQRDRYRRQTETQQAEIERLREENARLTRPPSVATPAPAAATPPEPPDPADAAIRERLERLYPGLAKLPDVVGLAAKTGSIESAIAAVERFANAESQHLERFTNTQVDNLHRAAAEYVLGKDKPVSELPELVRRQLEIGFAQWVTADPQRTARYDAFDNKLVGEYWPIFRAAVYDPVRRSAAAGTLSAADSRPPLPQGGASAGPAAPAPPKPAVDDEDAIYDKAWLKSRELVAGG